MGRLQSQVLSLATAAAPQRPPGGGPLDGKGREEWKVGQCEPPHLIRQRTAAHPRPLATWLLYTSRAQPTLNGRTFAAVRNLAMVHPACTANPKRRVQSADNQSAGEAGAHSFAKAERHPMWLRTKRSNTWQRRDRLDGRSLNPKAVQGKCEEFEATTFAASNSTFASSSSPARPQGDKAGGGWLHVWSCPLSAVHKFPT